MFLKKILVLCAIIATIFTTTNALSPTPAYADSNFGCRQLLGLTSWDCGLKEFDNKENLKSNVITIAANVFVDITVIAAYLVLGYVIYGGYQYIFSSGDAGKITAAKKTLTNAFVGLAIVLLANVILNTVRIALLGTNGELAKDCINTQCIDGVTLVTNILHWIIGVAGLAAAIFAIMGGISYLTSSGDSAKLKKAKDTIMYALIGLAIAGLAQAITAFVSNMIREAKNTSYSNKILIAKEYHENQID